MAFNQMTPKTKTFLLSAFYPLLMVHNLMQQLPSNGCFDFKKVTLHEKVVGKNGIQAESQFLNSLDIEKNQNLSFLFYNSQTTILKSLLHFTTSWIY